MNPDLVLPPPTTGAGADLPEADKRRYLTELVVNSVPSATSKRSYRMSLEQFFAWWASAAPEEIFSRALVQRFRASLETRGLAPRTINLRLAAVRKLAEEAAGDHLLPEATAAAVRSVKGARVLGRRTGNWLTKAQAEQLLALPDPHTLRGKRDLVLLWLFVTAGLRREELASLCIEQVQQREGRWCLVDMVGKGRRTRTVAIPAVTKEKIDAWLAAVPYQSGLLLGKVNKGGRFVGQGLSASSIYYQILHYAARLGVVFHPHDLRRTYGKLAHKGGGKIEQIQLSYGHASLTTTERYLGIEQDLEDAPCDHLHLTTARKED